MGYGETKQTARVGRLYEPRARYTRIVSYPMQQCFLNVFNVQSHIIFNNDSRREIFHSEYSFVTLLLLVFQRINCSICETRTSENLWIFYERSHSCSRITLFALRELVSAQYIRAPFSREALLTFCSCYEVVLSS